MTRTCISHSKPAAPVLLILAASAGLSSETVAAVESLANDASVDQVSAGLSSETVAAAESPANNASVDQIPQIVEVGESDMKKELTKAIAQNTATIGVFYEHAEQSRKMLLPKIMREAAQHFVKVDEPVDMEPIIEAAMKRYGYIIPLKPLESLSDMKQFLEKKSQDCKNDVMTEQAFSRLHSLIGIFQHVHESYPDLYKNISETVSKQPWFEVIKNHVSNTSDHDKE